MNIEKKLEMLGIVNIKKLNIESIKKIAKNVVEALENASPNMKEEFEKVYLRLENCDMYTASIIKPISKVNYIYENNSIYIDEEINIDTVNEQIMHECIHYLQDRRTIKNKKIGLCNFSDFKVYGIGINEAAVQYISAKAVDETPEIIERFGVRIKTITPKYYPFLTNLMDQIVYLLGEKVVVKAIFEGSNKFEDVLLDIFEEKTRKIIKSFDMILEYNNRLNEEQDETEIKLLQDKIASTYIETQNIIFTTYFNKICPRLTTLEEVDKYETKAIYYRNLMGTDLRNGNSSNEFFDTYMQELAKKMNKQIYEINKTKNANALVAVTENKIMKIFKKIASFLKT